MGENAATTGLSMITSQASMGVRYGRIELHYPERFGPGYINNTKSKKKDTVKQGVFMQSEEDLRIAHISGVEEQGRLQILLCELLKKNHELRLEMAHLQDDG